MSFRNGCPGARLFKDVRPEDIACPHCGYLVEIWSDEIKARCPNCHGLVLRERQASCIDWCRSAKECLGEETYQRLKGSK
ncbi:MAG: phosphohydrolase [Chloroflexi bacterium]|nr:phosphohydrolase [Chloroflexota bacterium]MCL5074123.1 phosphohydrolase [Chloroflexota bacterium]